MSIRPWNRRIKHKSTDGAVYIGETDPSGRTTERDNLNMISPTASVPDFDGRSNVLFVSVPPNWSNERQDSFQWRIKYQ